MKAEILSIGTELLMGEIVDTNSSWLAAQLPRLGIQLRWATKVGDEPDLLYQAVARAWERSDLTITTGGLGPTSDDLTRETIARVLGEELYVQEELVEELRRYFAGRGIRMPETNVKQANLIPSAHVLPNPMGTAPGWWVERDGRIIVALPGPPRELERMWRYEVAPRLRGRATGVAIVTRTIKTFGITEGGLDQLLAPLFESENPQLGIYARSDGIHLRAIARGATEEEASALIVPMEEEIRRRVGEAIWGVDQETPEGQASALLRERGQELAVADAFTGGLLSGALLRAEGPVRGSLAATPRELAARLGAPTGGAEALAEAVRAFFDAPVGMALAPGEDGAVRLGLAERGRTASGPVQFMAGRHRAMDRAITHALLSLLRFLRGLPLMEARWRR